MAISLENVFGGNGSSETIDRLIDRQRQSGLVSFHVVAPVHLP